MSKAAELAALIANVNKGSSLAAKNFIINGSQNVSQRGTSFSFAHDGTTQAYTLDRFKFVMLNTDSLDGTVAQVSDGPSGTSFANSLKWTTGTAESAVASDEVMYAEQYIEAQNVAGLQYGTADAKPVTLSFWVKSSITGTFNSSLYQADGNRIMTKTYTISLANTWEYKTLTFAGDTGGTINDDNGEGLRPVWNIFAGSGYTSTDRTSWGSYSGTAWAFGHAQNAHATTAGATFFLTGCQLEIGEKATEFEVEPYETTLRKTSRYYSQIDRTDNQTCHIVCYAQAAQVARAGYHIPMRTAPSITETNFNLLHGSGSEEAITSVDDIHHDEQLVSFRLVCADNLTVGQAVCLYSNGVATLTFDAEL